MQPRGHTHPGASGLMANWLMLPVRQGCDDQPVGASQELVLVDEGHVGDVDGHAVGVLVEVEAALLQPLKVRGALDVQPALKDKAMARLSVSQSVCVVSVCRVQHLHFPPQPPHRRGPRWSLNDVLCPRLSYSETIIISRCFVSKIVPYLFSFKGVGGR